MSAGSAFGSLTNLFIVGLVWAVFGAVLAAINAMIPGWHLSQAAMNLIWIMEVAYMFLPIIYLILVVLNHWINTKNEQNARV